MKKSVVMSLMTAVGLFFALCWLLSGKPDNADLLASFNPIEAIMGLSFGLSFAAGLPTVIAIMISIAVLVLIPGAVFLVARRLLRRFDG